MYVYQEKGIFTKLTLNHTIIDRGGQKTMRDRKKTSKCLKRCLPSFILRHNYRSFPKHKLLLT